MTGEEKGNGSWAQCYSTIIFLSLDFDHRVLWRHISSGVKHSPKDDAITQADPIKPTDSYKEKMCSGDYCRYLCNFLSLCCSLEWNTDTETNQDKERGRQTKTTSTTSIASSCLGTPALPCAYCKEQVLSWTLEREKGEEREERQNREHSRGGEALTDHSPLRQWQTGTTDSEKTHSYRRKVDTPKTLMHAFCPVCFLLSFFNMHKTTE